jgi:signal transduction histidine kinase
MLSISSITGGLQQAVLVVVAGILLGLTVYLADPSLLGTAGLTQEGLVLAGTLGVLFAAVWGGLWSAVDTTVESLDMTLSLANVATVAGGQGVAALAGLFIAVGTGNLLLEPLLNQPLWPSLLGAGAVVLLGASASGLVYLHRYHERTRSAATEAAASQVSALQGALRPSEIVHTLDRIAATAPEEPDAASALAHNLASLLRYRLGTLDLTPVTLADELHAVGQYMSVQAAQPDTAIEFHADVPDAVLDTPLPGGVLLPLLENAVVHGATQNACRVVLQARRSDDQVCVTIFDTGPGFDTTNPDVLLSRGHGLERVSRRLDQFAGADAGLSIVPNGVHVCVPVE